MTHIFKGKRIKDFEAPMDSIIHNTDFCSSFMSKTGLISTASITPQHFSHDDFDNLIEKRNKEFK